MFRLISTIDISRQLARISTKKSLKGHFLLPEGGALIMTYFWYVVSFGQGLISHVKLVANQTMYIEDISIFCFMVISLQWPPHPCHTISHQIKLFITRHHTDSDSDSDKSQEFINQISSQSVKICRRSLLKCGNYQKWSLFLHSPGMPTRNQTACVGYWHWTTMPVIATGLHRRPLRVGYWQWTAPFEDCCHCTPLHVFEAITLPSLYLLGSNLNMSLHRSTRVVPVNFCPVNNVWSRQKCKTALQLRFPQGPCPKFNQ